MFKKCLIIFIGFSWMNLNAAFIDKAMDEFKRIESQGILHSFIVHVKDRGESRTKSFGRRELQSDDLFEIGSLTKGITGLLIKAAIDEDKLSLESKMAEFFNADEVIHQEITIKELLTHSSGLPKDFFEGFNFSNPYIDFNKEKLHKILNSMKLKEKKVNYSNVGASLLGLVLEKIYGMSYEDLVAKFKVQHNLSQFRIETGEKTLVPGYSSWFNKVEPFNYKAIEAAGGIKSNILTMGQLGGLFLKGSFKSAQVNLLEMGEYGIGYFWGQSKDASIVTHTGEINGHSSFLIVDTTKKRSITVLANTRYDLSFLYDLIEEKPLKLNKDFFIKSIFKKLKSP